MGYFRAVRKSFSYIAQDKGKDLIPQTSSQPEENQLEIVGVHDNEHTRQLAKDFNAVAQSKSRIGQKIVSYIKQNNYGLATMQMSKDDYGTIREDKPYIIVNKSVVGSRESISTIVHEAVHLTQRLHPKIKDADTSRWSLHALQTMSLSEEAAAYAIERLFDEEMAAPEKTQNMSQQDYKRYIENLGKQYYDQFFDDKNLVTSYNIMTIHYALECMSDGYIADPTRKSFSLNMVRKMGRIDDDINISRKAKMPSTSERFADNEEIKHLFEMIELIQIRHMRGQTSSAYQKRYRAAQKNRNPFFGLLNISPTELCNKMNIYHQYVIDKSTIKLETHKDTLDPEAYALECATLYDKAYIRAARILAKTYKNKKTYQMRIPKSAYKK